MASDTQEESRWSAMERIKRAQSARPEDGEKNVFEMPRPTRLRDKIALFFMSPDLTRQFQAQQSDSYGRGFIDALTILKKVSGLSYIEAIGLRHSPMVVHPFLNSDMKKWNDKYVQSTKPTNRRKHHATKTSSPTSNRHKTR